MQGHGLIKGIGMVNCVYVNPLTQEHWIIDYRIYDPDSDGKTKLDHVREMPTNLVHRKRLPFRRVLMDIWYATRDLMLFIESPEKIYHCPLRANRQVDDSGAKCPYWRDSLERCKRFAHGKTIKIKGFPKHHKGEVVPGWGVDTPHGLGCHQRPHSGLFAGHTRRVRPALEDRAVSSRGQTTDQNRALPTPHSAHPAQSHRLRRIRVDSSR